MKREFITWDRFTLSSRNNVDPTLEIRNGKWDIDFQETGFGNTETDARFIGIIEYDETKVSEELLLRFLNKFSYHSFTRISDTKVSELLLKWYNTEVVLDASRNIIDNRPELNKE